MTQDQKKQAKQAAYEASLEEVATAGKGEGGDEEPLEDLDFGSKKKGKKGKGKNEAEDDDVRTHDFARASPEPERRRRMHGGHACSPH